MRKRVSWLLLACILVISLCSVAMAASNIEQQVLKQGMSGPEVYILQNKLIEYGYYEGSPDGDFGMNTFMAVIKFQLDCGIEPDGIVGSRTLEVLRDFDAVGTTANRGHIERRRTGQQIVSFAKQFCGVPYVWAGHSPYGFDCSGFVYYIFSNSGINIPRMADEQFEIGLSVHQELQLGDLVFFSTYEPGPSHVGIYIGEGLFIHASSGAGQVTVTPLSTAYYKARYLGARRII
jgi:hypothetical protein